MRLQHPQFGFFNNEKWEHRQILYGVIVHPKEEDCFEYRLKAQVIRKPAHPGKQPHCVGDGVKARRWSFDDPESFVDIQCLGRKCEFSQGDNPACKPWMRFLFLVAWPQAKTARPQILCKFTSRGWRTVANFVGFFKYITQTASGMGLESYSLMGFPFSIEHTYQTQPDRGRKYQVVTITPSTEPSEFFYRQSERLRAIQSKQFTAITDHTQQEPEVVSEDFKGVSWGN